MTPRFLHQRILLNCCLAALLLFYSIAGCNLSAQTPSATANRESGSSGPAAHQPATTGVTSEQLRSHAGRLVRELAGRNLTVLVEAPFVVIGDESAEVVGERCRGTIRWAVKHLKALYFENDPDHVIEIWLFEGEDSYNTGCEELTGKPPHTPYGFYSARERKLIMNIATGGGTLVHEIVHPFINANFPACPSWFNEGLASLYEQCREVEGRISGSTNWRLRGLQLAIEAGRVPAFEVLLATTSREFYDDQSGIHYAQARYLCHALQERGLLVDFYHRFRENAGDDPTGAATLRAVLGTEDLAAFQQEWEDEILKLEF